MHSLFTTIVAVLCLVFALCFAAPNAHADSITAGFLDFTLIAWGPAPTSGFFVFDNSTGLILTYSELERRGIQLCASWRHSWVGSRN
jgi:hypothetical protein